MANNKQVTAEYFDFKDAVSDQNGIKPACRLCGKIVAATWQGREGSREKGLWNAINLQHHLIEWHNTEWTTKIHPRMKFKLTPNKRSSAPGNTTEKLHKLERVATESVNFSCFWCGVQMTQRGIINHRRAKGFGGESGCKHFGGLYKTSHLAPELNAAIEESKRDQMTAEELELQQATNLAKFKSYISEGIDTIPVCKEDVNRTARDCGVYIQLENGMNSIEGLIYAGRTQLQGNRRSSNHKSSYTLRGSYIPSYNTLHVALECTLLESMGAEYLLLLLKDIYSDYLGRPYNKIMPYPYIPHSQQLDSQHAAENLAIHSKGRRLVADLVLDAISLWNNKGDSELIVMEVDDTFVTPSTSSDTPSSSKPISRRAKRRLDAKKANPVVVEPVTCRKRKPSPLCVDRVNELGPSTPGISSPFDRMTILFEGAKQLTPTERKIVNKKMFDFDKGIENVKSASQP